MNRIVKDATIKASPYPSLEGLRSHVPAFVAAYNFAKHLKALRWRTPFEAIQDAWTKDPSPFKINPHHLIPRPNSPLLGVSRFARGHRRELSMRQLRQTLGVARSTSRPVAAKA